MSNRRTPLYAWHVEHGARMVPFGGWDMPVQYTSVIEEHKAVRSGAGLFDISHMARLHFSGPDSLPLLEKVFTNKVTGMKDGQVKYGLVLNEDGHILDDVLVYKWFDDYSMVVNASNREKIVAWLKAHSGKGKVKLVDATESTVMIAVQGPTAIDLMRQVFESEETALKYYYARRTWYRDEVCIVSRTGYTGEDGFEVIVDNKFAKRIWQQFHDAGAVACGLGARDTLRLEAAMPLYGHELSEAINPLDAGLGWAVKMDKDDFIGNAALEKLTGIRNVRVGLELEGNRAAREGCPLVVDGTPVGTTTSGSYVPTLEKSIAMGYVPSTHAAVGTAIQVDIRGSMVPAKVVAMPFYKRPGK